MSKERQRLIEELEKQRDSVIMSLVYSNHAEMSDDDAVLVYEVLKQTFEKRHVKWPVEKVELLINSIGGYASAAYKIVKIIRQFAKEFNVIVLEKAKSAATLLALGSDKIYMTRYSELGPIDPLVSHPLMPRIMIPARAIQKFIDEILPTIYPRYGTEVSEYFLKVDYAHVGFCRATLEEAMEYAKRLLEHYHFRSKEVKKEEIEMIIKALLSYPSHDFVIDFEEATSLGLNVELLRLEHEDIVWSLYNEYRRTLNDVVLIVETKDYSREVKRPKVTIW